MWKPQKNCLTGIIERYGGIQGAGNLQWFIPVAGTTAWGQNRTVPGVLGFKCQIWVIVWDSGGSRNETLSRRWECRCRGPIGVDT